MEFYRTAESAATGNSAIAQPAQLCEQYRPQAWADVVGQDKVVRKIQLLAGRGLAGRAYWISGQSGTGKTTIARLIAAEVATEWATEELDAQALTPARLRDIERAMGTMGFGAKPGRAYIVNEAHGLSKPAIRQLLVLLERLPAHVVWIFTTTCDGQQSLFEEIEDGVRHADRRPAPGTLRSRHLAPGASECWPGPPRSAPAARPRAASAMRR